MRLSLLRWVRSGQFVADVMKGGGESGGNFEAHSLAASWVSKLPILTR